MEDNQNSGTWETSKMSYTEIKECVTPGCDSNATTDFDGLCFACNLGLKLIRGWYKKKKVWEWTYAKILSEENMQKLSKCANKAVPEKTHGEHSLQSPTTVQFVPVVRAKLLKQTCDAVACRKKVRIIGFRCRCKGTFCNLHRCSEAHFCKVDYRALGAFEISKNNPRVVAEKISPI